MSQAKVCSSFVSANGLNSAGPVFGCIVKLFSHVFVEGTYCALLDKFSQYKALGREQQRPSWYAIDDGFYKLLCQVCRCRGTLLAIVVTCEVLFLLAHAQLTRFLMFYAIACQNS